MNSPIICLQAPAPTVIGLLLDVSGSMEQALNIGTSIHAHENRMTAVFEALKKIVCCEYGNCRDDFIFVEMFGLSLDRIKSCDLISLLCGYLDETSIPPEFQRWLNDNPEGKWLMQFSVVFAEVVTALKKFKTGKNALASLIESERFDHVLVWLPCIKKDIDALLLYCALCENRDKMCAMAGMISKVSSVAASTVDVTSNVVGMVFGSVFIMFSPTKIDLHDIMNKQVTERFIDNGIDSDAYRFAMKTVSEYLSAIKLYKVNDVADLVKRFEERENCVNDFSERMKEVLFGDTPLRNSMISAQSVFGGRKVPVPANKILFVISDGESTDGDPLPIAEKMKRENVTIVTCFLTARNILQPRKLCCTADVMWSNGEKTLFNMSSERSCFDRPLSALPKSGWALPVEGDCKLFVRANSLEVVNEFCGLVSNPLTSKSMDVMMDIVSTAVYSDYLNSNVAEFKATNQGNLGICYAHAVGAVFVLAMSRVIGRVAAATDLTESYPTFSTVRDALIRKNATGELVGTNTQKVLKLTAENYRLHYVEVDEIKAREALMKGRPVAARFWLNAADWTTFTQFYGTNKKGILSSKDLTRNKCMCKSGSCNCSGHAVVLVRCSKNSLTFLNSWGVSFANSGLFSIADSNCLGEMKFFDVFWRTSDLFPVEIANYEKKKNIISANYVRDSATVRESLCACPECSKSYRVCDYKGSFDNAICPKGHQFCSDDEILRAYLYFPV